MHKGERSATLGVRDEERPCLVDAVAPLRYIVAVETARCLVCRIFLHQFALATHRLLAILPCVVEVTQVYADAYRGTCHAHAKRLAEACHLTVAHGLNEIGDDHEEDDEEIIIGHLHMVGFHLKG